jgi:hypothetical protein
MLADYSSPLHHLATRPGLSPELRMHLFALPQAWQGHANYRGLAEFWQAVHGMLRAESAALAGGLERLAALAPDDPLAASLLDHARHLGGRFVAHAHGHHQIEDFHYFPRFKRLFPQLQRPVDLLDGDHRVLEEVLDSVEQGVRALRTGPADRDAVDRILDDARKLERILARHLDDEEEIVIPALLQG